MKAVVQDTYGPAAILKTRDIDRPEITDEEVLKRKLAAFASVAEEQVQEDSEVDLCLHQF